VGALIHIPDIDQNRVGIFFLPAPDLPRTTRQSAAIWISVVVGRWQNMTVQIRRVQDRNTNCVGIEGRRSICERRDGANQSRLAGEFQKFPASPRCVRVKHRLFQWTDILALLRPISQMKMLRLHSLDRKTVSLRLRHA